MFFHKVETNHVIFKRYKTKKVILLRSFGYSGELNINKAKICDFNKNIVLIPKGSIVSAKLFKGNDQGIIELITLNSSDLNFIWNKLYGLNKFIFDKDTEEINAFEDFISHKDKGICDIFIMNRLVQKQRCMKAIVKQLLMQSTLNILLSLYIKGEDISIIFEYESELSLTEKLAYIFTKDPCKTWTLELAAQSMALSVSALRRSLTNEDESFSQILNNVRISIAENHLRLGSFSILKISNLSGFSSSAYFCTVFKKKHSITPKEFRERYKVSNH
ncbi:helix-turn-helix transcriptional regulator [Vibrio rotiferianus]|uniref:helix-turn-helix transcriptional regulator n=1 Tax=Vibrio rotiferianus TaxID=190895 RepID=UPI00406A594F